MPFLLLSTIAQCDSPDDACRRTYGVYEAVMQTVTREWPRRRYARIAGSHAFYNDPEALSLIDQVIAAARDPHVWATPLAETATAYSAVPKTCHADAGGISAFRHPRVP